MCYSKSIASMSAALALSCGGAAWADGLGDLKAALARLPGQAAVKVTLEINSLIRSGDSEATEEKKGHARFTLEDGARGLQVVYGKELMARLDADRRARAKDAKARTAVLSVLDELDATELLPLISAAPQLSVALGLAVLKSEKSTEYEGRAARLLSLEIPLETRSATEREHTKAYENTLQVWITADGTPLATRSKQESTVGVALVSIVKRVDESCAYGVRGDRLLTVRHEKTEVVFGAGEKGETHVTTTLRAL
jgi:hypothetical protein